MPKRSAGLLMYRHRQGRLEVLLVHPGGPLWKRKDEGSWFLPKGEVGVDEDPLAAARREFEEETGFAVGDDLIPLGRVKHRSGKMVDAWAFRGDCEPSALRSNSFEMEWPPRSGRRRSFPEVDRAAFFTVEEAAVKMHRDELDLVTRLQNKLRDGKVDL